MSLARRLVHALPPWTAPALRRAYCVVQGWGDARWIARTGWELLPPAELRYHVGSVRPEDYVRIGRRCAEDLVRVLASVGCDFASLEHVLDFGCGTGRTLAWLRDRGPRLSGTDLHAGCIDWARGRLAFAEFRPNRAAPPLDYPAASFDLVFSLSVFTHLDEGDQRAWLAELRRVTRPGALLVLSTHGPSRTGDLSPAERAALEAQGFLARPARGLWGVFERYFNSYHLEVWVRRVWGESFAIRAYLPRGLYDYQDLYVLERDR